MISPKTFLRELRSRGIELFVGVPDSLLSSFCAYLDDNVSKNEHVITANEGNAIGVASGYHMATGQLAAVYMQNSGLGNTVNPLTSLADAEVYKIPMLLIIGWRGAPNEPDEPQHVKQGRITTEQLELLEIPYWILDTGSNVESVLQATFNHLKVSGSPAALLVRKGTFGDYKSQKLDSYSAVIQREEALRKILELVSSKDLIISTTGKTSRELFELRTARGEPHQDFLTVGGMGHTASIAQGVCLGKPNRNVICIDGDGSVIMHLGAMPVIANSGTDNLLHIILNNAAHESVGGQPTVADRINFKLLAEAFGYKNYACAESIDEIENCWRKLRSSEKGPKLLEIRIKKGSRKDLGRPTSSPEQNKIAFMKKAGIEDAC